MLAACAHSETSVSQDETSVLSPALTCVHIWMFVFGGTLGQNIKTIGVFIYFYLLNLCLEDKSIRVSAYEVLECRRKDGEAKYI